MIDQFHKSDVVTGFIATTALPAPFLVPFLDEITKIVTILYSSGGFIWISIQIYKHFKK